MIPADIRSYLRTRGRASLSDLALRFDVDADALRGMLEVWERKGRVRRLSAGSGCAGCCGCGETVPDVYEWIRDT